MTSILITGGSGSFGQAFVARLLAENRFSRIAIYSRGEHLQEEMAARFKHDSRLRFFIGDVRDLTRLEMALRGVSVVVHAAALKVVPIAEYNPTECVATNVYGAQNVITASLRAGVGRVVALSTDKAVSPINLYGTTKLAAEKIFVAANAMAAGACAFNAVRYGNVVGSRGSVIPFFKKLLVQGADFLPITDPRMTRFWITMDEAIDLVMRGMESAPGTILVPKIPSMKIVDLAEAMAPGYPTKVVGIRPGEKVHECLLTEDEARTTTDDGVHYTIRQSLGAGEPLPEGFRYTSDGNSRWLTAEELRKAI